MSWAFIPKDKESHRRVLSRGVPGSGLNRQRALLATTVRRCRDPVKPRCWLQCVVIEVLRGECFLNLL